MPTKATSSFVWTVARERLTARTSGSVARVSIWAVGAASSTGAGWVLRYGVSTGVAAISWVINHLPSIRATFWSAPTTTATVLLSALM